MCELYPQWVVKEDLTRKLGSNKTFTSGLEEEVAKTIDNHDLCKHFSVSRLANGNFYCHQCQQELKLILNK